MASSRWASSSCWSSSDSSWMTSASRSSSIASATSYRSSGSRSRRMPAASAARSPSNEASTCWRAAHRMAGQFGRVHSTDVGPADHLHRRPPDDPAGAFPDGEPGDHPVPAAGLLDRHVDDDRRTGSRRELDLHAEQLADQPQLQRPLLEPAQAHRSGRQRDRRAIPGCRRAASARRSVVWSAVPRPARARAAACDRAAAPPRCREPCRSTHHWARTPAARRVGRRRRGCWAARGSG